MVDTGSWELQIRDEPRLLIENFRVWEAAPSEGDFGRIRPDDRFGLWPALVERGLFGELRIVENIDLGSAFVRVDAPKTEP